MWEQVFHITMKSLNFNKILIINRGESKVEEVKIKGVYRHYKGNLYMVEDIAYHSETEEKLVVYRALYGNHTVWVRPYHMFLEEVNKNGQKYRFELQD